jgi:protein SCO1/2
MIAKSLLARVAIMVIALSLNGCGKDDGATRYALTGKVQGVDLVSREVLVAHDDIKDFMPAMTMPLRMRDPEGFIAGLSGTRLVRLRRGDVIKATLAVKDAESWIENVTVVKYEPPPIKPTPPPKESRIGEPVVDFDLIDQDGKPLRLSDYRGHPLALTFIYTRCPLPEFCPRIMKNFQALEKLIEDDKDLRGAARLLSVSFDVEFDRPEVLQAFGSAFVTDRGNGPFARWKLATGTKESVDRLGRFFGLIFFKEGDQFAHSLVTAVIGPDGRLVKEWSGSDWDVNEAKAALEVAASGKVAR